MNIQDDYNRIYNIFIQNFFLKNCQKYFDSKKILQSILKESIKNAGLEMPDRLEKGWLFDFSNTLINLNYFIIYLNENEEQIKKVMNKSVSGSLYDEFINQKFKSESTNEIKYKDLFRSIRNAFAHNNYELINSQENNTKIRIYNRKRKTIKIQFDNHKTIPQLVEDIKKQNGEYSITKLTSTYAKLASFDEYDNENTFNEIFSINAINFLLGKIIDFINQYFKELNSQGILLIDVGN